MGNGGIKNTLGAWGARALPLSGSNIDKVATITPPNNESQAIPSAQKRVKKKKKPTTPATNPASSNSNVPCLNRTVRKSEGMLAQIPPTTRSTPLGKQITAMYVAAVAALIVLTRMFTKRKEKANEIKLSKMKASAVKFVTFRIVGSVANVVMIAPILVYNIVFY